MSIGKTSWYRNIRYVGRGEQSRVASRLRRPIELAIILMAWWAATGVHAAGLFVEGYAGRESYAPGEDVTFHVSTSAPEFTLEIARLGLSTEVVWREAGIAGQRHPVPPNSSSHGCGWPPVRSLKIPESWTSGYYEVTVSAEDRGGQFEHRGRRAAESRFFFVVRASKASLGSNRILLQLATHTYNAYNNWGGHSLYGYNSRSGLQGHRVSIERPPASQFRRWELPFARWAERHGYELDYATNRDLEERPELLANYRLVLSVGHDEYWSTPMRDALEAYIGRGGNVAFFSGNVSCWQVRSEDGGQAITCWKQNYHNDPAYLAGDNASITTKWCHEILDRPENQLTGVGYLWGGFHRSHGHVMNGSGGYRTHRPEHWVFAGTDLQVGEEFGMEDSIVGYECDGCELEWREGLPYPTYRDGTPRSFTVLATAPAQWSASDAAWYKGWDAERLGAACLGVYERGGTVFTAASTDWSHGLRGGDPVVMQITRNVLDRLNR